ncbi:hypothetical protein CRE_29940 [Caenorhabditis remanei]|uniref:Uncharacterized protein n=1 Tax=Caenorhabditis remanei TaxID=31234 RepID=E3MMA0_CAERE|nr:hypothetical protein CRE_29940 [Caenorhabditis remanei]
MVRQKKASAIATALQKPVFVQPTTPVPVAFIPGYSFSFGSQYILPVGTKCNETDTGAIQYKFHESLSTKSSDSKSSISKSAEKHTTPSTALPSDECGERSSSYVPQRFIPCFDLTTDVLGGVGDENSYHLRQKLHQDERRFHENETMSNSGDRDADVSEDGIGRHETEEKLANSGDTAEVEEEEKGEEEEEIVIADVGEIGDAMTAAVNDKEDVESATSSSCGTKHQKSQLEKLLMQPVKKPVYQEFQQPFIVTFSAIGNQPQPSSQNSHLPKTMQFYQPPAQQHLARSTPPPGFVPPYGMGMRPHEEETRQIMNLDSQQTHNSSPSSSW